MVSQMSTSIPGLHPAPTQHAKLIAWVEEIAALTQPDQVHWCDGSQAEWDLLTGQLIASGTLEQLDPAKRPNSFIARSDPKDVARVESRTFICSKLQIDAGPTNNWTDPDQMRATLADLFKGCIPSAWGRSARRSARWALRLRIAPMWPSQCAS
jgi:phosphoenolpyruvate carboxykinase (GTP)